MTHGRPALCGTVRRCRLHGVAGRYRGPHTPRSVSCALALEADLLLQQETPLCGVPSPGDRATQTFHRLPASAAHSWVHRPDRFSRLLHLPSDLQGVGALLAHQVPSAGKYRRSPGQGGLPGPTNTAGACGELRDPGGRRRSHVSEQRERRSGQIERRDGGEGKGRKPRRRHSRSECLQRHSGAPCTGGPSFAWCVAKAAPQRKQVLSIRYLRKTEGWRRDAADRAVLEGRRHSRVRDECL